MKISVPHASLAVLWLYLLVTFSIGTKTVAAPILNDTGKFVATTAPQAATVCSLSITPTVSGCYAVSGVSKATVSVEIDWSTAPANDYIVVTTGAQSRTITPGVITVTYAQLVGTLTGTQTIVSPQVVAFEVNANSAVGTITARFNSTPACTATASFTAPASCLPTACSGTNLGGTVFKDFDDDGKRDTGETVGLPLVTVKAIDCDGTVYTTTTDSYGQYTLPVPASNYPVRVEFSNLPAVYNEGVYGSNSHSTVQFVKAPGCNIDLGVSNPADYCSNDPQIFVPCFTYGDPLVAGSTSASSDALVSFPYGVSSNTFTGEEPLATASQVGTIWGLAYNKTTKKLFQSAVLKRHAGLGPAGLSGIYVTSYANPLVPVTSTFLSVSAIGINVGTIPSNAARGLQGDRTLSSRDPDSFSLTAKVGIGDLEISEDGNKLWMVNLFDKKLYSVDITQYNLDGTTRPTAANVASYAIPATCPNGAYRPWAVKVYDGKVYVGGLCDAQVSGNKSDMRASVYELNGTSFTKVFDFPLTYPKGYPAAGNRNITGWFPWTDNFDALLDGTTLRHPVPIFTDIEFDVDGSMVLAFGDRTGFQGGDRNWRPDGTSTTLYETNSQAGDLLRAFYANGTFVLENNAKAGNAVGFGAGNSQGPGFGEFYNDNWLQDGGTNVYYHAENVMGGLALKPGTGEVVVTTIDPVDTHPYAGGVRYMNNTTGITTGAYAVYITRGPDGVQNPATFAKATGLGDIELSCNTITSIEIGNRVWIDTNKDGVQDACESPLAGVTVDLYKGTTKIASTTTNASGEYYFSSKSKLTPGSWTGTGADTTLLANTAYSVVFGNGQFASDILSVNGSSLRLTQANSTTTATANDLNDSDAQVATLAGTTAPVISVTTGALGSTNHTLDVGFYPLLASLGDYVFIDANKDGIQNAGDTPIAGVKVTLYLNGVASATTVTNASGLYSFTGLTPGSSNSYVVGFTAPTGYTATLTHVGSATADSDADPITGKTQSVTLAPEENNPTLDAGFYLIPAGLGDYAFIDANKDGIQNTGDTPLPGVLVTLYTNGVASATTVTNASGFYSFTGLTPGSSNSYVVGFTAPTGYTATLTHVGSVTADSDADPITGKTQSVTLVPGEFNPTLDAGFYLLPAGLGDYVFEDVNKNGQQDAGDLPIQGVTVTLISSGTVVATTMTNASGLYSFTGLTPGTPYSVSFTAPAGYSATVQNMGNDATDSDGDPATGVTGTYSLTADEFNSTVDMGYYKPASLGDYVWVDANKNGQQDSGEAPIPGVTVTLYINGVASATTITNASGLYSFTGLTPGSSLSYAVGFTTPAGYTATVSNLGNDASDSDPVNGTTASVTLASGENNSTLDAGFYLLPAGLGDYVFEDVNKNGQQDAGDLPIQGVTVTLLSSGTVVATTTTNASGLYSFTGLTPGTPYSVSFTAPAGYTATLQNTGNDATDSDGDPVTGLTTVYSLTANEFNSTIDMGYYKLSPALSLAKYVDKSKAKIGDVLTYTLVLTNSGAGVATNVVVRDSSSTGLTYVANSATAPTGTTFTSGVPISNWTISTISSGQSLSLTFQAKVDSSGILYNKATIPGDTASVCTSIPFIMCAGDVYTFRLTAASGRSSYKWFKDNVEIVGQTTNVLDVSAPGTYSLAVDNVTGKCPDFICCPFIVEEDSLPTFKAVAIPVTCVGNVAQANGKIVLSNVNAAYSYQYSLGTSFNEAASLSGAKQVIPAGGAIATNLANPAAILSYTIRVYNASGCYSDVTVQLLPTICGCPADACVPFVIKQSKRPIRIGEK